MSDDGPKIVELGVSNPLQGDNRELSQEDTSSNRICAIAGEAAPGVLFGARRSGVYRGAGAGSLQNVALSSRQNRYGFNCFNRTPSKLNRVCDHLNTERAEK